MESIYERSRIFTFLKQVKAYVNKQKWEILDKKLQNVIKM